MEVSDPSSVGSGLVGAPTGSRTDIQPPEGILAFSLLQTAYRGNKVHSDGL